MQAYPLHWPEAWPRTPNWKIEDSRFRITSDGARKGMLNEIRRLIGGHYKREDVIISTDIRLRHDGEPYATQRTPDDKGVAVYFEYKGKPMVFACDRWNCIRDNMHSIAKTIEALRGIDRWGASDMLERAFKGFVAIEHQGEESWRDVLQMGPRPDGRSDAVWLAEVEHKFRVLVSADHPQNGGDGKNIKKLKAARDQAREELRP